MKQRFKTFITRPSTMLGGAMSRAALALLMMLLTTATAWADTETVSYIDADGHEQTVDATVLTGGEITIYNGWYVVSSDISYTGRQINTGNANIILKDNCTMTMSYDGGTPLNLYNPLTIYGQSGGTGKLVVNTSNMIAINGETNTFTVNGGIVESKSTDTWGRALFCGSLVFNGGKLKLEGSDGVMGKSNTSKTVTLNWRNATDRVYISSFKNISSVTVGGAGGKCFADADGNYYGGTYTDNFSTLAGKELQPATAYTLTLGSGITTTTEPLFTYSDVDYYAGTVTLPAAPAGWIYAYTVNGAAIDGNTFTITVNTTVSRTAVPDPAHFSVNAAGTEYTIHTADGWGVFCDALQDNDTYNRFSGKTVKLGGDIGTAQDPITRMAGSQYHDFCGTFDGQGYTLTFNYGSAVSYGSDNYVAPFSYVSTTKADPNDAADSPAAFRNLHVCGDIYTSGIQAGGIVSREWGTVSITNCRSSVNIHSSHEDEGTHGGLVACVNNGSITIEGCLFDGRLLGASTSKCGGFIGWRGGSANIYNSLFAPAEVTVSNEGSATFARNKVDCYNSYYTNAFYDATYAPYLDDGTVSPAKWNNGIAARSITAGENVTISNLALTGTPTEYNVSGITAYSGGGLALDNGATLYYGSGDQVSLTLSNSATGAPLGYQYGYSASAGTINGYMLTMADANATVNVDTDVLLSTGQPVSVSYIDAAGTTDSHDAIALDETMTSLAANQWYFVGKDIDYTQTVTLGGNTTLILADGCTLNIGTSSKRISSGYCIDGSIGYKDLTIYGQTAQTGTLNAYNSASDSNPVNVNNYTQHGGNVTIDGTKKTALESIRDITITRGTLTAITDDDCTWGNTAIRSGTGRNVSVSGGTVNASGRYAISGALNITAGTVNATGSRTAIYSSTTVSGGNLNATGGSYSIYNNISFTGGSANVTLTGEIYKNLTIAAGLVFTDGTNYYAGTLTADEKTAISGQTLTRLTALPLADAADNTAAIDKCNGATDIDITLQGRTLFKDGKWNTLCLPFDLVLEESVLDGDNVTAMVLRTSDSGLSGTTLTLNFDDATTIPAGTPFIIKWESGDNLVNPVFSGVTVDDTNRDVNFTGGSFKGTYAPKSWDGEDRSILFLGEDNNLHWPLAGANINACRAYFELADGENARAFNLNFGEGSVETGIVSLSKEPRNQGNIIPKFPDSLEYYTLDGRKLDGQPTTKGLYIHNGRKVVIK